MSGRKLRYWEAALMIAFAMTLLAGSCAAAGQSALASRVLRLHVVANSDSVYDQEVKLQVRDAVLEAAQPMLSHAKTSADAQASLSTHLEELASVARETLERFGSHDSVNVTIEDQWFPTREYGDFALPAGQYRALRVVIGSGKGQNWWCVVFPPLCLAGVTEDVAEQAMAAGLSEDQAALITGRDGSYMLKFKIIEWWETITKKWQ